MEAEGRAEGPGPERRCLCCGQATLRYWSMSMCPSCLRAGQRMEQRVAMLEQCLRAFVELDRDVREQEHYLRGVLHFNEAQMLAAALNVRGEALVAEARALLERAPVVEGRDA